MKKLPDKQKSKGLMIRNSTAEFLMFTADSRQDGLEVRFQDETVWLTQKLMAELFKCSSDNVSLHLKNIFKDGELEKKSVTEEFSVTARRVTRVKLMRSLNVRTRSQKDKAMYDTHLKYGYTLKEIAEYIGNIIL